MTTRRGFFGTCAAALALAGIGPEEILYASAKVTPHLVGKVRVYVDGNLLRLCVEANAKEGWARAMQNDSKGNRIIDWRKKECVTHLVRGRVHIVRFAS